MRKTWAPIGHTPIFRHRYTRERISAISAVTVSPSRKRLGLYFRFHSTNITGMEVIGFLRHLLRHLRGPMVLLWDGGTIHRRVIVKEFVRQHKRFHVHRFPAYAPELNPDEFVWTKAKALWPMVRPKMLSSLAGDCAAPCIASETLRGFFGPAFTPRNSLGPEWQYIHYLCDAQ